MSRFCVLLLVCLAPSLSWSFAFNFPTFSGATTTPVDRTKRVSGTAGEIQPPPPESQLQPQLLQVDQVVTRVAVAGATGRVGRYVVQELLNRGVKEVVALVRDTESATELFHGSSTNIDPSLLSNLQIQSCNLANQRQVSNGT